jgi:ribosomal protein S18 acetylase RimI-like enzyme
VTTRTPSDPPEDDDEDVVEVRVRRLHRRDVNKTWEFLKLVFRDVNRETVEYQRPRTKHRFLDSYDDDDIEQLLFEAGGQVVGYAECTFEISGTDNWLNPRYFEKRGMRPLFVDELAVHPDFQGRGVGVFMIEQLQHLGRRRGCTHLVLEVAENNRSALAFYRRRGFQKLDAAIFMARRVSPNEPELLPPRILGAKREEHEEAADAESLVLELPEAAAGSEPPTRVRGRADEEVESGRKKRAMKASKRKTAKASTRESATPKAGSKPRQPATKKPATRGAASNAKTTKKASVRTKRAP